MRNRGRFLVLALMAASALAYSQPQQNFDNVEIHVLPVQGNVWMLIGGGGNVTVQVGKDGVLLVDTSYAALAPRIMAEIRKLSDGPLRYVINTHVHADHTDGNDALVKLGMTDASPGRPLVVANLAVQERMAKLPSNAPGAIPQAKWPNDTYSTPYKDLFLNNEAVVIYHIPEAHTDGDSVVFFRRSDVISAGDLFTPGRYPFIDLDRGGNVQGLIQGLNRILELTVPARMQEGGTFVIPGHGRLCEEADVVEYRDMITIIRDRVQDLIGKGMTLEQVKAAKPTFDYDTEYGADKNPAAADRFVEAIYKSLKK